MILNLGVNDIPYSFAPSRGKSKTGRSQVSTTGDVAEILEARYSVMQTFVALHKDEIVEALHDSLAGAFETVMMGGGRNFDPNAAGTSEIEDMFRQFLDRKEMDGKVAGVPTAASLAGVNPRLKHPYAKKNAPRPSFIASGLYQSSMKCWIEE